MMLKPVKTRKHRKSIMHQKDGTCYLYMMLNGDYTYKQILQEHHIFGGPNRIHSESEGLKVYLCLKHHIEGPEAVHNNAEIMSWLRKEGQKAYEREHSRDDFIKLFGKNYIL